jgi:hypothetical protein
MKPVVLFIVSVLPVLGCGVVPDSPLETNPPLTDADFDGWRSDSRAPLGEVQGTHADRSAPDAQRSLLDGVVDRVIAHVDSVDAQVHFKQTNGSWASATTVEPQPRGLATPKSPERHSSPLQPRSPERTTAGPNAVARITPPPPAPPAESLALTQDPAATVETLDIPKGWTGAAVYHAATCQHCPALLAALRSRATKMSGNYLLVDGCWFLLVDWDERPDVDRPKIPGLPAVLFFVDGHELLKDRVIGFGNRLGELDAIISRHPQFAKRRQVRSNLSYDAAYSGTFTMPACPCGPSCVCQPGSQCGCLSGVTTASPLWYEMPSCGVTNSAGVSLFGMPVISGSMGSYPINAQ